MNKRVEGIACQIRMNVICPGCLSIMEHKGDYMACTYTECENYRKLATIPVVHVFYTGDLAPPNKLIQDTAKHNKQRQPQPDNHHQPPQDVGTCDR